MSFFFFSFAKRPFSKFNPCFKRFYLYTTPRNNEFCSFSGEFESWRSMEGTTRCSANYSPLTPISFLERAAKVYRDRTSLVFGSERHTWTQTHHRCLKLASALTQLGISPGDVVATLAPNIPAMYELHFAVPMTGSVLCTLNSRHDSSMLSILLQHSNARAIFVDRLLLCTARGALDRLVKADKPRKPPILISISQFHNEQPSTDFDSDSHSESSESSDYDYDYESLIETGIVEFDVRKPRSEFDPISINYTSGTTSRPKGVVYSHRGAYLNSLATMIIHKMVEFPVYLWTVPMFHCNGWCLPWGVAAQGGTNVCIRKITPNCVFENISEHNVTHFGCAPTVLNMIVNSPAAQTLRLRHRVQVMTGGSPPPSQVLSKMEELGFEMSHLYGLTETYGPGTYCVWKPEWDSESEEERCKLKSRQGMHHLGLEDVDVKDSVTMESVANDGKSVGEVMFKGNTVMSGYFQDSEATQASFKGGWFHSGDLAVKHKDGYIEIKDRLKDVIISGGENISSVEVETVLYGHPAVLEAAVVARPDDHWGQTPCAFVKLREGFDDKVDAEAIITFCKERLPRYMAPKTVVFGDLPKTSTGKIQKYLLRERAKDINSL